MSPWILLFTFISGYLFSLFVEFIQDYRLRRIDPDLDRAFEASLRLGQAPEEK